MANSPPSLWVGLDDPRIAAGGSGGNIASSSVAPDSSPFSIPMVQSPTPTGGVSPWTSFPSYWPEAGFSPLNSR